eukprot:m.232023 g.232023  ORF g.232023 m.232023 type:complete len:500 (+) comp26044_c0_seq1:334-1833(+)
MSVDGASDHIRRDSDASYTTFASEEDTPQGRDPSDPLFGIGGGGTGIGGSGSCNGSGGGRGRASGGVTGVDVDDWRTVIGVAICLFCVHCQPSEAYLTKYLRDDVGISEDLLDQYVWPTDVWTQLVTLIPAGLLAEVIGYRPVAIFGLLCRLATRVILIWGSGLGEMAAMQGLYAIGTNTDVILLTIMYVAVSSSRFKLVTGAAFVAQHTGSFVGSGVGQAMADAEQHNLRRLFYVSLAFTAAGLGVFVALCGPPRRDPPVALTTLLTTKGPGPTWAVVRGLYTTGAVRRWAGWYIFVSSLNNLMLNYYQNQIEDVSPNAKLGLYQMLLEFCGVCGVGAATALASRLAGRPTAVIALSSAAGATAYLVALDNSSSVAYVYVGNAAAFAISLFASTVGAYTVAGAIESRSLKDKNARGDGGPVEDEGSRYAVVFTCNGTLALLWASIISAIGTSEKWETPEFYRVTVIELFTVAAVALLLEGVVRYAPLFTRGTSQQSVA